MDDQSNSLRLPMFSFVPMACIIIFVLGGFGLAMADDCGKLSKEVIDLRAQYRAVARTVAQGDTNVGFDKLTAILDKIVETKRRMHSLGCGERKKAVKKNF